MKRILRFTLILLLCFCNGIVFGQVNVFPYTESFENETFTEGMNVYFINNWLGNYVDGTRIFQENTNVNSGSSALGLWPIAEEGGDSEEIEIIVKVNLDLCGMENVVAKFWVATEATAAYKHVKLYL